MERETAGKAALIYVTSSLVCHDTYEGMATDSVVPCHYQSVTSELLSDKKCVFFLYMVRKFFPKIFEWTLLLHDTVLMIQFPDITSAVDWALKAN